MADQVYFETDDVITEASLVAALDRPQLTDYVATGLGLTADYSTPDVDVASGRAFIGGYTVEADARTGVALTDSTVNYVYLVYDPSTDDSVSIQVNTTGSDPADPSLLLGTVDTGSDSTTEENRTPNFDGEHSGTFDGELVSTTGDHAGTLDSTGGTHSGDFDGSITGDIPANGNDITNAGAVSAEELSNVYDHIVASTDDLVSTVAAASAGESVWVGPGTHTVSLDANEEGLVIGADDITLYVAGGATIQLASGETTSSTNGGLIVASAGVSGLTVTGPGTLDGNIANNTEISNPANWGLVRADDNVSDLRIENVTMQNSPGDAVRPEGSSGSEITNVWVTDCTIRDNVEGIVWTYADDVKVLNNVIDTTTTQDAIEPVQSSGWAVRGNTIRDAAQSAIDVFDAAIDGVIADNYITGTASSVIYIEGGVPNTDIEIHDNHIDGSGAAGINVVATAAHEDINIHDNRIEGVDQQGINVATGTLGVDVRDNTLKGCGFQGISHNGDDCSVDGNRCVNNGQAGSGTRGIRAGGDHQDITGNQCYDDQGTTTQEFGIQVDGTSQFVHGNHCWDNGTSQLTDQTDGASVVSDNMTV